MFAVETELEPRDHPVGVRLEGGGAVSSPTTWGYVPFSKPHADGGELDEGEVARRQLVVAGRDPAVLLQSADQALDYVALAVQAPVHQPGRPLGLELRDDGADAVPSEVVPHGPPRVALVARDRPRPQLGPARAGALH